MGRKVRHPGKQTPKKRKRALENWNAGNRVLRLLAHLRGSHQYGQREEPGSLQDSELKDAS
jgi:hypothetical protein